MGYINCLLFIVSSLSFINCGKDTAVKFSEIDHVRVFYLSESVPTMVSVDACDQLFNYLDFLKDTVVEDERFIRVLSKEINRLEASAKESDMHELRIRCTIIMKNREKHVLCLGESFTTMLDGELKEDRDELHSLIKGLVYSRVLQKSQVTDLN